MRLAVLAGLVALGRTAAADIAFPREQPPPAPRPAVLTAPEAPAAVDLAPLAPSGELPAPRPEQEQILIQLIASTPDSQVDEKADYYVRLATLYTAQQLHATRPELAKASLLKAVRAYRALTGNDAFRSYPKLDRALFLFGYTLQAGKYMKEARSVYDRLLKDYPDSSYVPAAHLAFADYYLEQHQLADAEARYKVVLRFPKAPAYAYALYRIGRIDLELHRDQEALETFSQAARLAPQAPLRDAAESGFVEAYAASGTPAKAHVAFERLDPARVGELTTEYARYACATRIEGPASAGAAARLEAMVALAHDARGRCAANAAAMADELARTWHAEAARTHGLDAIAAARRAYTAYLSFPDTDDHDEMQAGLAELAWLQAAIAPSPERWDAAATAFAALPDDPDAIAAAVLAWKNALGPAPAARVDLAAAARAHARPRTLAAFDDRVLTALEQRAGALEDPDRIAETRLYVAAQYRRRGHPERAIAPLADLVEELPQHATTELAARLVLDSMLRAGQRDDARIYAGDLAADDELMADRPALAHDVAFVLGTIRPRPPRHR